MSILLGILTFILILVSLFLILVVLAQKTKDSGVGAALGGGAAEAAFGAETGNVLTRMTKYSAITFFVLAFALYLGRIYERKNAAAEAGSALPTIAAPAAPASVPIASPTPGMETPGAATSPLSIPGASTPTDNASSAAPATSPSTAPATSTPPADTAKQP